MIEYYKINGEIFTKAELIRHSKQKFQQKGITNWEKDLYSFISLWISEHKSISVQTSGSTGKPKLYLISKAQMIQSAARTLNYFEVKANQNALLCLPVQYIAGMMMVVRAFVGNLNLITCPPENLKDLNIHENIDFTAMIPLQIEKMLTSKVNMDIFQKILIGGAEFKASLAQQVKGTFKASIWETYGMTETLTQVAVRNIDGVIANEPFNALSGITFSKDERNCLIIHDTLIQKNPLITNDCVELLNNQCFKYLGRIDNVINSGGIKIQPENIENILAPHINGMFCISSVNDKKLGEKVVLVIEKGAKNKRLEDIFEKLDKYQRPKKILELTKFPVSQNGKLDRKAVKNAIAVSI